MKTSAGPDILRFLPPKTGWKRNQFNIKPYLVGKPTEELAKDLGLAAPVIHLNSNENPLGPSPRALAALHQTATRVNFYPDDTCYYLIKSLAAELGVTENEIIISNGSAEIIDFIARCFVNPGDEVIMADQTFIVYPVVTALAQGKIITVPLKNFRHNLEMMAEAITPKTKVIFIANPNNPTGTISTAEEMGRFMKRVPESVLVVFDEAYYEYVRSRDYPRTLPYLKSNCQVIILRTFSKIYGLAGLRVGYGLARPDIINRLKRVHLTFNVNRLAQNSALAALKDRQHLNKSIKTNETGKKFLYAQFKKLALPYVPTETNFIFLPVGPKGQDMALSLLKYGILVRYLPTPDVSRSGIRITIGTMTQNKKLVNALKKVLCHSERSEESQL